jgi:hypothetical protein
MTTGTIAYQNKILPQENIKGTSYDRKIQFRCFQQTIFNIFVHGYFIPKYGYSKYKKTCLQFYKEKIENFLILNKN